MATPRIPVEKFYVNHLARTMATCSSDDGHQLQLREYQAKPFEGELVIDTKKSKGGWVRLKAPDGITYAMHHSETVKAIAAGAEVKGGCMSGTFGFCRVSTSISLCWLGPIPERVELFAYMKGITEQALTEMERVIKIHGGSHVDFKSTETGLKSGNYGAWKVEVVPTFSVSPKIETEWVTDVHFKHRPTHLKPIRPDAKVTVKLGAQSEELRSLFAYTRMAG